MTSIAGFEEGYSVLMPVYEKERPEYLKASIKSMLVQTLPCADFVLVCDGPLPKELEEVIDWAASELGERFQCVRLAQNQGLGKALEKGLCYCRCPVVARMDSDDLSRPTRCEKQFHMIKEKHYGIVGGSLKEFVNEPGDRESLRVLPEKPEHIMEFAKVRNPFNHPCVMFLKDAVLEAGGYEDFPGFEDYFLWIRMLKNGCRGYNLQEVVLDMRTGNGMYARRGGMDYIRNLIRFQKYLKEQKIIGYGRFFKNCISRSLVAAFPGKLRSLLYYCFLREKNGRKPHGRSS